MLFREGEKGKRDGRKGHKGRKGLKGINKLIFLNKLYSFLLINKISKKYFIISFRPLCLFLPFVLFFP